MGYQFVVLCCARGCSDQATDSVCLSASMCSGSPQAEDAGGVLKVAEHEGDAPILLQAQEKKRAHIIRMHIRSSSDALASHDGQPRSREGCMRFTCQAAAAVWVAVHRKQQHRG